jgi:hypothetical protein
MNVTFTRPLPARRHIHPGKPRFVLAHAAALLLGACFQYAFLSCFEQHQPDAGQIDDYASSVTSTLLAGIGPGA